MAVESGTGMYLTSRPYASTEYHTSPDTSMALPPDYCHSTARPTGVDMLSKEAFSKHVRDALTHLYDPIYLQNHALAEVLVLAEAPNHRIRAQMLRETILEAIEQLRPDSRLPFGSKEWIAYRILSLRYLEALTPTKAAERLNISERHFFRQHHNAIRAVTAVLWDSYTRAARENTQSSDRASTDHTDEIAGTARMIAESARQMVEHSRRRRIDVHEVVRTLEHSLRSLATRKGVDLVLCTPPVALWLWMDPAVLRQIVLNTAVAMLEHDALGPMRLEIGHRYDRVLIGIECSRTRELMPDELGSSSLAVARRLAENEGGHIVVYQGKEDIARVEITLPISKATVLMIDDSADAIALFERYLRGTDVEIVGVPDGEKGVELARTLKPQMIILDVMMPSQDGWQVLQSLRANSSLASTPIVVCSVLDQPDLALTMGADDLIQKPVSQQAFLQILQRWVDHPDSPAASS